MTNKIQCVVGCAIPPKGQGRTYCEVSNILGGEEAQKREVLQKVIRKIVRGECSPKMADMLICRQLTDHLESELLSAGWRLETQSIGWDDGEETDG